MGRGQRVVRPHKPACPAIKPQKAATLPLFTMHKAASVSERMKSDPLVPGRVDNALVLEINLRWPLWRVAVSQCLASMAARRQPKAHTAYSVSLVAADQRAAPSSKGSPASAVRQQIANGLCKPWPLCSNLPGARSKLERPCGLCRRLDFPG